MASKDGIDFFGNIYAPRIIKSRWLIHVKEEAEIAHILRQNMFALPSAILLYYREHTQVHEYDNRNIFPYKVGKDV